MDTRPCVICQRQRDDPLHGPPLGELAHPNVPVRIEQHDYDPGERRKLIRRMEDREHIIEIVERATRRKE